MTGEQSSGWCTNWSAYNTPRLWAMVAGEDNPEAWRQADAWSAVVVDLEEQLERLWKAHKLLGTAWPPGRSEASAAFVEELSNLIGRMDLAREDAKSTASALRNILYALRQAKNEIEPLWQQYRTRSDDIVPAWWDKAENEIDAKARDHVIVAERVVERNALGIKIPDPYHFLAPGKREGEGELPHPGVGSDATGYRSFTSAGTSIVTPHDPPPPLPGQMPTTFAPPGAVGDSTVWHPKDSDSSPPNGSERPAAIPPSLRDPFTERPPVGPELSEVLPALPPPANTPITTPPPVGQPPGVLPPGGFLPGVGLMPVVGGGNGVRPIGGGSSGTLKGSSGRIPGLMPSGVVIGQTPFGTYGRVPDDGATKAGRAGVKPAPPTWLPGGAGQSTAGANTILPATGRKNINAAEDEILQFEPDNPWAVRQGVDSVIEPPRLNLVRESNLGVIGQQL